MLLSTICPLQREQSKLFVDADVGRMMHAALELLFTWSLSPEPPGPPARSLQAEEAASCPGPGPTSQTRWSGGSGRGA